MRAGRARRARRGSGRRRRPGRRRREAPRATRGRGARGSRSPRPDRPVPSCPERVRLRNRALHRGRGRGLADEVRKVAGGDRALALVVQARICGVDFIAPAPGREHARERARGRQLAGKEVEQVGERPGVDLAEGALVGVEHGRHDARDLLAGRPGEVVGRIDALRGQVRRARLVDPVVGRAGVVLDVLETALSPQHGQDVLGRRELARVVGRPKGGAGGGEVEHASGVFLRLVHERFHGGGWRRFLGRLDPGPDVRGGGQGVSRAERGGGA